MAKTSAPQVVELSPVQLEALLVKLAGALPAETYQLVETLLRTLQWITGALEAKNCGGRRERYSKLTDRNGSGGRLPCGMKKAGGFCPRPALR